MRKDYIVLPVCYRYREAREVLRKWYNGLPVYRFVDIVSGISIVALIIHYLLPESNEVLEGIVGWSELILGGVVFGLINKSSKNKSE